MTNTMSIRSFVRSKIVDACRVRALNYVCLGIYTVSRFALWRRSGYVAAWGRRHPFDRDVGVKTSGWLPGYLIGTPGTACAPVQPSTLRRALDQIDNLHQLTFVDFGCGKGRALFVAAEYPFEQIIGVEMSSLVSAVARRNIRRYGRVRPHLHPPIHVVEADATEYVFPDQPTVLFLYNPFPPDAVAVVCSNIVRSLTLTPRSFYVVYVNPVAASVFDACPLLERRFAAQLPHAPDELEFAPDASDAVIIWQDAGNSAPPPPGNRFAQPAIIHPLWRAEFRSSV